jgi:hypothetical protein
MPLRRRPVAPTTALSESVVRVCLSGWDAALPDGADADGQLFELWQANVDGVRALWRQHRDFLLAEATRLGISRPGEWLQRQAD